MENLSSSPDLFSLALGRTLRDGGMTRAASSLEADDWLSKARGVAEMLAARNGEVTSDEVLRVCPRPENVSPNATGSLFKGKQWSCIGFTQTSQVQGHARTIRRWVLR